MIVWDLASGKISNLMSQLSLQYFGPTFVHTGSKTAASLPQYIDPYELLQDERIIQ